MKTPLLVLIYLSEESQALIGDKFDIIYAPDRETRIAAIQGAASEVKVVLTNGAVGLSAADMQALSKLELVCALGAGFENIDTDHARAHGIKVGTGAGTNDDCVADHAMGLLLSVMRNIPRLDQACREGIWRDDLRLPPQLAGKRLGIVGLGTIGKKIARRAAAFDMEVGYFNRTRRDDVDYHYLDSVLHLASWADALVIATPGGAATRHLISTKELHALGPQGFLVNISRGSVVDTAALAQVLKDGELGGAGLDVYESEPKPPQALLEFDNVVLTPHMAGWSPDAITASLRQFLHNARDYTD
ncbi:lactate dehydrogenase-like 2-hydroxyacid dehydrogenase [Herbaspirillum sp. Sphag1AN]|uniref:2-hydroxyacid dehydrogenase n=1 Tax=unclassified Herbaspirillum TaxID=2624150 RepID=UPI00161D1468|nr:MULTISPECIES: 2-hydroxyacid dehydrogenase [unclassified Herbaspirillum]MBB3213136.1 lactate dehydrogenase-like 2-hydroxyacid dehydrogenase [Herbaspirillum sp. Sphag1AN]MBB3246333.1 lactate dehydrogenase-like 2-hydroxyacid dehydrogenase [Herbaspirillum sp. Sphag64]